MARTTRPPKSCMRDFVAGVICEGPRTRYERASSGAKSAGMMEPMFAADSARRRVRKMEVFGEDILVVVFVL